MFKLIIEITYKMICILLPNVKLVSPFAHYIYLLKLNLPLLTVFQIHKIKKIKIMVNKIRITIS